ncbi:hypothetical protein [Allopontixanthobacter sp.]|uniref:hypothetical protein n=1 Tax=Allopontixanthobacter sp. TaxID=2906452 RepID=UPI002AB95B7D|nr:hypothetical protein [Allopontixanthobacter sp.]MDZ4306922.1 hypothetical protein [Allopontixanthobacter sp.]
MALRNALSKPMIAVLVLTQTFAGVSPAMAEDLPVRDFGPVMVSEANTDNVDHAIRAREVAGAGHYETGAFAGARLRISLGGNRNQPKVRAGLTIAPTLHHRVNQSAPDINFGEGLEFGHRSGHRFSLSAAGQDIGGKKNRAAQAGQDDDEGGLPDWALIAGGVVIAAGIGGLLFFEALDDASE